MTALFCLSLCLFICWMILEPLKAASPRVRWFDALLEDCTGPSPLRREELIQALTELEVDLNSQRISASDYQASKKELLENYAQ